MITVHIASILIISIAFFGESIFGFGAGLISIPLLSLLVGVKDAVTVVLVFQLLMGLLIFKTHKDISWKFALPMSVGLVAGSLIGTYMLAAVSADILRKFLALSVLLFLAKMVFFKGFTLGRDKKWGLLAGLVGGWFQGIIGTGGPVFTMYLSVVLPEKSAFRATLIFLFFATSIVRLIASVPVGLITFDTVKFTLPIIPFFILAIFMGQHIHKKIDQKYYQYAIYAVLLFAAVSMLLK